MTSTSNRTAPSGLSTLVFLPIILAILVASDEATSNDAADVWRCHFQERVEFFDSELPFCHASQYQPHPEGVPAT